MDVDPKSKQKHNIFILNVLFTYYIYSLIYKMGSKIYFSNSGHICCLLLHQHWMNEYRKCFR